MLADASSGKFESSVSGVVYTRANLPETASCTVVRLAEFKTHVPWNDVKHNYQIDSAFYDRLQAGGGCSSRLTHGPFKDIVFAAKKRLASSRQGHRAS